MAGRTVDRVSLATPSDKTKNLPVDWRFALAFVAVVLFGAFLRIVRLHSIPPGLFFDEAANLFDIQDVLHGAHPLYFPRNNGREAFFFYWASVFARVWGVTPYAIRLAAAIVGSLTVVTTFFCAREMLRCWMDDRRRADWTALVAAFVLGITYTHLHYSRIGLRSISLPLFLALCYGLLFRGVRRNSWVALAFAGVFGGISIYTYISSRIAPLLVVIVPLGLIASRRSWRPLLQSAFVILVWAAVVLPFGIYALRHPQDVQGHTDDVSILNPANDHGDPVGAALHGVVATFGGFAIRGTDNADQNLPGRPILDPLLSVFLAIGLMVLAAGAVHRETPGGEPTENPPTTADSQPVALATGSFFRPYVAVFLAGWIVTQSLPSVLSVGPPGFIRMTGTLPAIAIVVGLGVDAVARYLTARKVSVRTAVAAIVTALIVSTAWTVRDYFWLWGPSPIAYQWMMGHKVDSATYLGRWAADDRVFLAPLYAQDNTIRFLTQGASIESFDLGVSLVLPTDRTHDVKYAFPSSDQAEVEKVAAELPSSTSRTTVSDPSGRFPLLTVLNLSAKDLPTPPTSRIATFDGGIALVGARIDPTSLSPGQSVSISLEWLALQRQPYNYTVFVHLRDGANHAVAQIDRQPTAGSFPTTSWQTGDLIRDRYTLAVPGGVRPGEYRLVVGLYRLETLQRLGLRVGNGPDEANEVVAGRLTISGG